VSVSQSERKTLPQFSCDHRRFLPERYIRTAGK
jgi:hypothetical protein